MKNISKIALAFLFVCAATFAQTAFTTTTLTIALTARNTNTSGGAASGNIVVGSTTNMFAPGTNPAYGSIGSPTAANATYLIVDREVLRVIAVPSSTVVTVERGVQGTKAVGHAALATVYVAYANQLLNSDPTGACTGTLIAYLPQYSFTTGTFWSCPATGPNSGTWTKTGTVDSFTFTDYSFFVPATSCVGATTGTAGAGNDTLIVDGSVPALKISATNAGASVNTFTCTFTVDTRLTANKGVTLTSIDFLYSPQTTTLTSQTLSTFKSFTSPVAGLTETASSATLAAAGGTITQVPVVGSGNFTAVSAGQYYTTRAVMGTAQAVNTPLQTFVVTFVFSQSASAAQIVTSPGFWVNGTLSPL